MTPDEIYRRTTRNREETADLLDGLTPAQWAAPTLCAGWSVHDLAAHLVQPMLVGFGRFFLAAIRYRGDTAATVDHFTRRIATRPSEELVALLRAHASDQLHPPRVGPMGPFADSCIHRRDIAQPLGLPSTASGSDWLALLEYLTSGTAAPALTPGDRVAGLSFAPTDAAWSHGRGPVVEGSCEALVMAITGRVVALDELHGPGVELLRSRTSGLPAA